MKTPIQGKGFKGKEASHSKQKTLLPYCVCMKLYRSFSNETISPYIHHILTVGLQS